MFLKYFHSFLFDVCACGQKNFHTSCPDVDYRLGWIYKIPLVRLATFTRGISCMTQNRWEIWLLNYGSTANFTSLPAITDRGRSAAEKEDGISSLAFFLCPATTCIGQPKRQNAGYSLRVSTFFRGCHTARDVKPMKDARSELIIMSIIFRNLSYSKKDLTNRFSGIKNKTV